MDNSLRSHKPVRQHFPSVAVNFDLDLERVKVNQLARYLGQWSFNSKVIALTQTHTPSRLL